MLSHTLLVPSFSCALCTTHKRARVRARAHTHGPAQSSQKHVQNSAHARKQRYSPSLARICAQACASAHVRTRARAYGRAHGAEIRLARSADGGGRIGTSRLGRLVKINEYVATLPADGPVVFVLGALAHGKVEAGYVDEVRRGAARCRCAAPRRCGSTAEIRV